MLSLYLQYNGINNIIKGDAMAEYDNRINMINNKSIIDDYKKDQGIINDNRSIHTDSSTEIQLVVADIIEGQVIRTFNLTVKAQKLKQCKEGMDYLISKTKDLKFKDQPTHKDISIG
jgi:hypothetical protein